MLPPHFSAGGFVCTDCEDVGQNGDKVLLPQDKLGKGLPEAAPAVVDSAEAGSFLGGGKQAGVVGDVLQAPCSGAAWCSPPLFSVDETRLLTSWSYLFQKRKSNQLTLI